MLLKSRTDRCKNFIRDLELELGRSGSPRRDVRIDQGRINKGDLEAQQVRQECTQDCDFGSRFNANLVSEVHVLGHITLAVQFVDVRWIGPSRCLSW